MKPLFLRERQKAVRKGKSGMYDLIIAGSGPAGLSAAIYAKRAGLDTLVLEKNPMSGGQVLDTVRVDNYPGLAGISGFDLGMRFREHAGKLEVEFKQAEVKGICDEGDWKRVNTSEGDYRARTVIVATGATHRHLGIPGEEELTGRGVSCCAACDGAFFRGKTAAVVGGGDTAAEDTVFLAGICRKVYLIHRRDRLRAAKVLQDAVTALPNVELILNSRVKCIHGTDRVSGLTVFAENRGTFRLQTDGVFVAVGIRPNSESFIGQLAADEEGWLIAREDCAASMPGVFAAGDVRTKKLRQIVTAVADGANAAAGVQEFLLRDGLSYRKD